MAEKTTTTVPAAKAHVALNVRDVAVSAEFYRRMFGVEPSKVRRGYAKFDVQNPPLNFTLNERPFAERGALYHMGIQVTSTDDVLAVHARWGEAGLQPGTPIKTNCGYAIQDKAWVRDPDGNSWEVFVVLEDDRPEERVWFADLPASGASGASLNPCTCAPSESEAGARVAFTTASADDLDEVIALLGKVDLPLDGVREHFDGFVVARDEHGRLLGCAGMERHASVGLLRSVAVDPERRGRGIGAGLTAHVLADAAEAGVREIVLLTTAREFFSRRFGFTEAARADYEGRLAASPEWNLPRCSSAAFLRLELSTSGCANR